MSIISVNNLTYYYDGCDDAVYENVSFTLDTTWKTGLIGTFALSLPYDECHFVKSC